MKTNTSVVPPLNWIHPRQWTPVFFLEIEEITVQKCVDDKTKEGCYGTKLYSITLITSFEHAVLKVAPAGNHMGNILLAARNVPELP